ncbi:MAG: hypothetical protein KGI71_03790 [Patescibacteria group bacterium]|nr:hypothetical protein [Patescibacteria group bacterium]
MAKKTVFVAHPIGGDIANNIKKVLKICAEIHTDEIIPVAPYIVSLQYLRDEVVADRKLGMEANHECFRRKYVDELWLFGDRISEGMTGEARLAKKYGIPIVAKSRGTKRDLRKFTW